MKARDCFPDFFRKTAKPATRRENSLYRFFV